MASVITYDDTQEIDMALDAVLTYPPHDAPVRLFALFTSEDSAASVRYEELTAEGKIMQKRTWYAAEAVGEPEDEEPTEEPEESAQSTESPQIQDGDMSKATLLAQEWVAERLESYYAGMVDAIFAETEELAVAAANGIAGSGQRRYGSDFHWGVGRSSRPNGKESGCVRTGGGQQRRTGRRKMPADCAVYDERRRNSFGNAEAGGGQCAHGRIESCGIHAGRP